jgi:hypothetical protein
MLHPFFVLRLRPVHIFHQNVNVAQQITHQSFHQPLLASGGGLFVQNLSVYTLLLLPFCQTKNFFYRGIEPITHVSGVLLGSHDDAVFILVVDVWPTA